jgi:hypothetical protein
VGVQLPPPSRQVDLPLPRVAVERVPAGEEDDIDHMIRDLREQLRTRYPQGELMRRDAHPKAHGLVKAWLVIDRDCPRALRYGLFQPQREYRAWVRFSNGNPQVRHDLRADLRGMAIKVRLDDSTGPSLFNDMAHDFVLATGARFFGRDAHDFATFPAASESIPKTVRYFLRRPRALRAFIQGNVTPRSPLAATYFSQTPYRLGPHCVKYQVRPLGQQPGRRPAFGLIARQCLALRAALYETFKKAPARHLPGFNALRAALRRELHAGPARFELLVQRWPDLSALPVWAIEDATRGWHAPWTRVGLIVIERQTQIDRNDMAAEHATFNPGRTLAEHQAIGGVNRARTTIYQRMWEFRTEGGR